MINKISFSTIKIKQLKPKEKRYSIYDTKTPHLIMFVYPKGEKTFCYYGRINTRYPIYKTIGHFPDISVEEARQIAIKIQDELNQNKNPLKNSKIDNKYFYDYYKEYINYKELTLANSTIKDYQSYWNIHLKPLLEHKKVYQIDAELLQNLHIKMKNTPYQANRVIVFVKSIFNYLIKKKGYTGLNPANAVELYNEKAKNIILYPEEIGRMLQTMSNNKNTNSFLWHMAILFLLLFGARSSNVLEMKWSEIDLNKLLWIVPKTKNGEPKKYLIPEAIVPFFHDLKKYKIDGNDYVFPSKKSKSGHISSVKKHLNKLLKKIGIERHIRPHDLRHTYGTMSALSNHSPSIIQMELGHKTLNASIRYVNLSSEMITSYRNETIEKILSGIISMPQLVNHLNQPQYDEDTIAGQILNNIFRPKIVIPDKFITRDKLNEMYQEKFKNDKDQKNKLLKNIQK